MEKKQTAVEWLEQKIQEQRESGETDLRTTLYYCRQAKEMEKQQMKDVYMEHVLRPFKFNFKEYYNETYKKENER